MPWSMQCQADRSLFGAIVRRQRSVEVRLSSRFKLLTPNLGHDGAARTDPSGTLARTWVVLKQQAQHHRDDSTLKTVKRMAKAGWYTLS